MHRWLKRFANNEECHETPEQINAWLTYVQKGNCYHKIELEAGDYVCVLCGLIKTNMCNFVLDKRNLVDFWPRTYARKQYFDALFGKIYGLILIPIQESQIEKLVLEMKSPCTWYDVYQTFKSWHLNDWWICWNVICNKKKIIDTEPSIYNIMLYVDEQWTSSIRSKKKLNVLYMLFKVTQLVGRNTDWVPFKLRESAIKRLDEEWKLICEKLNWDFIPTELINKSIEWQKEF